MSVTKETTIWCDGEGCSLWHRESHLVWQIRKHLKNTGWSYQGKKDFCPTCTHKKLLTHYLNPV